MQKCFLKVCDVSSLPSLLSSWATVNNKKQQQQFYLGAGNKMLGAYIWCPNKRTQLNIWEFPLFLVYSYLYTHLAKPDKALITLHVLDSYLLLQGVEVVYHNTDEQIEDEERTKNDKCYKIDVRDYVAIPLWLLVKLKKGQKKTKGARLNHSLK